MQAIIEYNDTYTLKYHTVCESLNGVESIKLRAANGNTISIHEINGELVIKNN